MRRCARPDRGLVEQSEDLQLAAYVASGKMQKHVAVRALLHTFVQAERRISSGNALVRPGRSLPDDFRLELMGTLGQGKAAADLLAMFHVRTRGQSRPRLDFGNPLVPDFFLSHLDKEGQQTSCATAFRLLTGGESQRLLRVAIDETYWRPTWQPVSQFKNRDVAIVGGGWSDEANMAVLNPKDGRSDHDLARLTVSCVVTRCDCNRFTYELDLVPLFAGKGSQKSTLRGARGAVAGEL